jgi:hypothetical protein
VLLFRPGVPDADGFATFGIAIWVSAIVHHAGRQCSDQFVGAMKSTTRSWAHRRVVVGHIPRVCGNGREEGEKKCALHWKYHSAVRIA